MGAVDNDARLAGSQTRSDADSFVPDGKTLPRIRIVNAWSNSSVARTGKPEEVIVGAKYGVFKDPQEDYEVCHDSHADASEDPDGSPQKRQRS